MKPVKNIITKRYVIAIHDGIDNLLNRPSLSRIHLTRIEELKEQGTYYDYVVGDVGELLREEDMSFRIKTITGRLYEHAARYNWEEIYEYEAC